MIEYSVAEWVDDNGGVKKTAKLLKVTTHAIRIWLRGEGTPRVKTIVKMVTLSKGRLSFESIARQTTRTKAKKARLTC